MEIIKAPREYIVHMERITSDSTPGVLVSLVPAGTDIATLQLRRDDGGIVYLDASRSDWDGCRCEFFSDEQLALLSVARQRLIT